MMEKLSMALCSMKIDQLGFVFKDIEKQAKIMEEVYGIPKFSFTDDVKHVIDNKGVKTEINIKIGLSRCFGHQIELIQWKSGECIYKDFLDKGREGLQHVSIFVDELDPYIEEFTKKGFHSIHLGQIGKQRFAYFDTESTFGLLLEFQETVKRKRKR